MSQPDTMKPLSDRLGRLYERRQFTIKLGLDRIETLTAALDHPQHRYAVLHAAGTNGKGSTCACLDAILRAAGLRTGLYTSPHLVRFNERIRIDGACIGDAALAAGMDRIDAACRRAGLTGDDEPTFFEYTTALAFDCFREAGVQVAVIETGLGGRLDATNVVTPVVSIITPIGMDHAEHLGSTPEAVATEKAGIIKPGRPVVIAPQTETVMAVLVDTAKARQAPVYRVDTAVSLTSRPVDAAGQKLHYESTDGLAGTFTLPLAGEHQAANAATAILAAEVFAAAAGIPLDPDTVRTGLRDVCWPGRFTRLEADPPLYADAAHNPDGARALARLLQRQADGPVAIVTGMCADKDVEATVGILAACAHRLWAVPVPNSRTADPDRILAAARQVPASACAGLDEALTAARDWARAEGGCICVTGSIFLIGALYARLGRDPFAR